MEYALLAIVGLLADLFGGLLGIGAGVVMIPAMVMIFTAVSPRPESIHQYQAASLIVSFLFIAPAVVRHARAGAIVVGVWRWLVPAALVGIVAGVGASRLNIFTGENERYMRIIFGAFLAYVAVYNFRKLLDRPSDSTPPQDPLKLPWWKSLCVGLPMGFQAGLLGIAGGAMGVPAMQMFLRLPLRNAIATSTATILATSWLGAVVKNVSLGSDGTIRRSLVLAAFLTPTAMITSYLGGHLTHTLPLKIVRVVFIVLMLLAAVKMFGLV